MSVRIAAIVCAASLCAVLDSTAIQAPKPAVPLEPVGAIIEAFSRAPVVTLPAKPTGREITALMLAIIRDPRFPSVANDIVVEFGNARHQDLIDRYVRGDGVTEAEVRAAWRDVTEPTGTFDGPMTIEVFRAVREVNAKLPAAARLRILAGDPPIDWDHVKDKGDHRQWILRRDSHAADVVRREVLARGRKALLIYGNQHFPRFEVLANYDPVDWQYQTLTGFIERDGGKVFVIFAEGLALRNGRFQADTRTWPEYAVAHVRGTVLGAADFGEFQPAETRYAARGPDDFVPIPRDRWKARRLEEQADALIKLPETSTNLPALPGLCAEPGYAAMRIQRITVAGIPGEAERIRKVCGLTPGPH